MEKLTITRPDYSVKRNGEKIGKIQPGPFGWMAVDNTGKADHYYPCTTQREAAERVATLFDRQFLPTDTTDIPATDASGTRVGYYTYLGAYRTGVLNGKRTAYVDGDCLQVSADTVDTWTRPVLWIREDELEIIG